jgi:hypothetical protein
MREYCLFWKAFVCLFSKLCLFICNFKGKFICSRIKKKARAEGNFKAVLFFFVFLIFIFFS